MEKASPIEDYQWCVRFFKRMFSHCHQNILSDAYRPSAMMFLISIVLILADVTFVTTFFETEHYNKAVRYAAASYGCGIVQVCDPLSFPSIHLHTSIPLTGSGPSPCAFFPNRSPSNTFGWQNCAFCCPTWSSLPTFIGKIPSQPANIIRFAVDLHDAHEIYCSTHTTSMCFCMSWAFWWASLICGVIQAHRKYSMCTYRECICHRRWALCCWPYWTLCSWPLSPFAPYLWICFSYLDSVMFHWHRLSFKHKWRKWHSCSGRGDHLMATMSPLSGDIFCISSEYITNTMSRELGICKFQPE